MGPLCIYVLGLFKAIPRSDLQMGLGALLCGCIFLSVFVVPLIEYNRVHSKEIQCIPYSSQLETAVTDQPNHQLSGSAHSRQHPVILYGRFLILQFVLFPL